MLRAAWQEGVVGWPERGGACRRDAADVLGACVNIGLAFQGGGWCSWPTPQTNWLLPGLCTEPAALCRGVVQDHGQGRGRSARPQPRIAFQVQGVGGLPLVALPGFGFLLPLRPLDPGSPTPCPLCCVPGCLPWSHNNTTDEPGRHGHIPPHLAVAPKAASQQWGRGVSNTSPGCCHAGPALPQPG